MAALQAGLAGLLSRTLSYALALVSAVIALMLHLDLIGEKLSGARIPQDIDTPCGLFFLALAIIFLALGLAERPASFPDHQAEGDGFPEESQNHK